MKVDNEINILFVTHYSEMYGANKSMCQLIIELKEKYAIKPFVLMRLKGSICDFLDEYRIEYLVSHFYWWVYQKNKSNNLLHELFKQFLNIFRINTIKRKLEDRGFNLVYTNSIVTDVGFLLSKKFKCPHFWFLRERMDSYNFRFTLGKNIAKIRLQNKRNQFIVISDFIFKSYKPHIAEQRMIVIYNGIPVPKLLRSNNTPGRIIQICLVGLISEQKNQLDALKAMAYLVKTKNVTNIHLSVVGSSKQSYLIILEDYISSQNLGEYISLIGHQDNISSFLGNMHLGLICSRNEGFGRVTIEYMMNRMPVIASESGANPELINPGKNGELYQINNPNDLALKILKFVKKPELIENYGAYAQDFAILNFSSRINTTQIYNRLTKAIFNNVKQVN